MFTYQSYYISNDFNKYFIICNIAKTHFKLCTILCKSISYWKWVLCRGDSLVKQILENNDLEQLDENCSDIQTSNPNANKWGYLETSYRKYDRENKILIEILKEGKLKNIGGWKLVVCQVYIEPWSYVIKKSDDFWGSEYIIGDIN